MHTRAIVLSLCTLSAACAPTIKGAARQASKAAVDESVEQITSEESKTELAEAVRDPKVEAATHELSDQIAEGILRSLSSERSHEQIAALTRTFTETAVKQLVASLGSQQTRKQLEGVTTSVTDAALSRVAGSLKNDLGPAMGELLREDLAQGMSSALDTHLQPALGHTAQNVAYHAVLGANRGLDEVWLGQGGLVGDMQGLRATIPRWLWLGLAFLGLLTLALISGAVMAVARARRARAEVTRLESATLLLATAMREKQGSGEADEIVSLVQAALSNRADEQHRNRLLGALRMRGHH